MHSSRLFLLVLICSGLFIAYGLGGCGDHPCDDGEPDTCANIAHTVQDSCLVVEEDDYACLCCAHDKVPCDNPKEDYRWNENTHTCDLVPE